MRGTWAGERGTTAYVHVITTFQRRVANPVVRRLARHLRSQVVIETTGRVSGEPRRTPVGARLDGRTVWVVSEFGRRSNYVRNILRDPRVRVQIAGRWHAGIAHVVEDDDPCARLTRLPRLNSLMVRTVGTDLLTVRIDLDEAPSAR
jgi:deazaflavin-dependent oxidoreductase (nitroreductase family)